MTPLPPPPPAEVEIDTALVGALLRDQHPDLASLPLRMAGSGWDNTMVRIGAHLVARLPRRASAVELLEREARWLPEIAGTGLPVAVPVPVRRGVPSPRYPWPWLVMPWVAGRPYSHAPCLERHAEVAAARLLGSFLRSLHQVAPPDAPRNPYRGMPLAQRRRITDEHFVRLDAALAATAPALRSIFDTAEAAAPWAGGARWLHGDLHPRNVIVRRRRIVAVVDFGDCTSGDPATDLAAAWLFFDHPEARDALREAAAADDHTWRRARGWAVAHALAHLAGGGGADVHRTIGMQAIERLVRDEGPTGYQSSSR